MLSFLLHCCAPGLWVGRLHLALPQHASHDGLHQPPGIPLAEHRALDALQHALNVLMLASHSAPPVDCPRHLQCRRHKLPALGHQLEGVWASQTELAAARNAHAHALRLQQLPHRGHLEASTPRGGLINKMPAPLHL
eukprot:8508775-Pyramimonas_sp.AAC.1